MTQPEQPNNAPPEAPRPTPNYDQLIPLAPAARLQRINALTDDQLNVLAEEVISLGPAVNRDIEQLVHNRMAERLLEARRMNATDRASVQMKALAERMKLRVRAGTPLAAFVDPLTPAVNPREEGRETLDTQLFVSSANGFLYLHGADAEATGLDNEVRNHREALQFILSQLRGEKIGDLRRIRVPKDSAGKPDRAKLPEFVRTDAATQAMIRKHNLLGDQVNALLFAVCVLDARHADMQLMMDKRPTPHTKRVDDMTLLEFVQEASQMSTFVQDFQTELQANMQGASVWERPERVKTALLSSVKIDVPRLIQGSAALRQSLTELGLTEPQMEPFGRFYGHATQGRIGINNLPGFMPTSWVNTQEAAMVPKFKEVIGQMHGYIRDNAVDYLKLYCHNEGMQGGAKFAKILEDYLKANPPQMSVKDVVELYIAIQQAEQQIKRDRALPQDLMNVTATGGLMLQLKVVQVVGEVDPSAGRAFSAFIIREGAAAAATGQSDKIKLPRHVLEPLGKAMGTAGEYLGTNIANQYVRAVRNVGDYLDGGLRFNVMGTSVGLPSKAWQAGIHVLLPFMFIWRPIVKISNWFAAGTRRENDRRELGRGVGREYRNYVNPAFGGKLARYVNPLAARSVERNRRTLLDKYDLWTQKLAMGPLSNIQLDAIEDMLALGNKTDAELLAPLRATTAAGVPAFTEEQARRILTLPEIMGTRARRTGTTPPPTPTPRT